MSIAKHVKKSMKNYTCTKCGDEIPEGSEYRYFKPGYRGRVKVRRCMKPECAPRRSELTDNKMADVYAAQEDAEASIRALKWDDEGDWADQVGQIEELLTEAAGTAEGLIEEDEEAIQNAPMLEEQLGERRDALEEWVGELQSFEPSDQPEEEKPEVGGDLEDWLADASEKFDRAVEEALEILGNLAV